MVYVENDKMHGIHETYNVKTMPHKAWIRSDKYIKSDCLTNLVNSVVHINYANELAVPVPFHE